MTALDDKLLPAVLAAITKVGVSADYTRLLTDYTPGTGEASIEADGEAQESMEEVTVSPPAPANIDLWAGTAAQSGDTVVYMAGSGLEWEPRTADTITINNRRYTVTGVRRFESGESVCAWALLLEGGSA